MRLVEFDTSAVHTEKLAALSQFLLSRITDTNAKKTMSLPSFIKSAGNLGISLTSDQLKSLIQQEPLSNYIANIEGDNETGEIIFKGADEVAPNMSVDQARDTVNTMAKRAASKPGL
jgi:LAS superfamily LD-carboxypeptidase LdcB